MCPNKTMNVNPHILLPCCNIKRLDISGHVIFILHQDPVPSQATKVWDVGNILKTAVVTAAGVPELRRLKSENHC